MANLDNDFLEKIMTNQTAPSNALALNPSSASTPGGPAPMDDLNAGIYATAASFGIDPAQNRDVMAQHIQSLLQASDQKKQLAQQAEEQAKLQATATEEKKEPPKPSEKKGEGEDNLQSLIDRGNNPVGDEYWSTYYNNLSATAAEGFPGAPGDPGTMPVHFWADNLDQTTVAKNIEGAFPGAISLSSMVDGPMGRILNLNVESPEAFILAERETLDTGEFRIPKTNSIFKVKTDPEGIAQLKSAYPSYQFARTKTDEEEAFLKKNQQIEQMAKKEEQGIIDQLEVGMEEMGWSKEVAVQKNDRGWGDSADKQLTIYDKEITVLENKLEKSENQADDMVSTPGGMVDYNGKAIPKSYLTQLLNKLGNEDSSTRKQLDEKKEKRRKLKTASNRTGITEQWQNELAKEAAELDKINPILSATMNNAQKMVYNNPELPEQTRREMYVPYQDSINQIGTVVINKSQIRNYEDSIKTIKEKLGQGDEPVGFSRFSRFISSQKLSVGERVELTNALQATMWQGKNINPTFLTKASEEYAKLPPETRKKMAYWVSSGSGIDKYPVQDKNDSGALLYTDNKTSGTTTEALDYDGEANQPRYRKVLHQSKFMQQLNILAKNSGVSEQNRGEFDKLMMFLISPQAPTILEAWEFNNLPEGQKEQLFKQAPKERRNTLVTLGENTKAINKYYKWDNKQNDTLDALIGGVTNSYYNE